MKEKKNWKISLFTWLYRIFCYLVPGGYALWAFLIETLINDETSYFDKIGISGIFVIAIIVIIAIFFYGKYLKNKITNITNACIECTNDVKKHLLVVKKRQWEAKQELLRNACFIAPFIIAWLVVSLVEKQVVSLRGTLMILSSSMAFGLGFNSIAQWFKTREVKNGN